MIMIITLLRCADGIGLDRSFQSRMLLTVTNVQGTVLAMLFSRLVKLCAEVPG